MGLYVVAAPDVADGRFTHPLALGHQAATPMGLPLRLGLQGRVDHRLDPLGSIDRLAAAPRRDLPQTLQALFGKPLTPQRDRVAIDADRRGDAQIGSALGGSQYDPATQCDLLGSPVCGQPLLKLLTLRGGEGQGPARIRHTVSIVDTDVPIQLFAGHYTRSSVAGCLVRPFPRLFASFSFSSPTKRPAKSTWPRAAGPRATSAHDARTDAVTRWWDEDAGSAPPVVTRSP